MDLNNIRVKSLDEVTSFCKDNSMLYIETSSKSGENVDKLFNNLAELIYDNYINKSLEGKKVYGVKSSIDICKSDINETILYSFESTIIIFIS